MEPSRCHRGRVSWYPALVFAAGSVDVPRSPAKLPVQCCLGGPHAGIRLDTYATVANYGAAVRTYEAFLTQHTPSKHRVFALVDEDFEEQLEAIATFPDHLSAQCLTDALNAVLTDAKNAEKRLERAIENVPQSVRASALQLRKFLANNSRKDFSSGRIARLLQHTPHDGFMIFPVSGCPTSGCTSCSEACSNACQNCKKCTEFACDSCYFDDDITPRSACILSAAGEILADQIYDDIAEGGQYPGMSKESTWQTLPNCTREQNVNFYNRMAHSFEDISSDLKSGITPQPNCTAEEIALHLILDEADRITTDEPELANHFGKFLPTSPYDYGWSILHDSLFDDKDYEDYLYDKFSEKEGELDHWFNLFDDQIKRDPNREFRH